MGTWPMFNSRPKGLVKNIKPLYNQGSVSVSRAGSGDYSPESID